MFDAKGFLKAQLEPRTETVPLPVLAPWFKDEVPAITVRGLTGEELAKVREAAEKNKAAGQMIEAMVGGTDKERIAAIRQAMGVADGVTDDYAKRIEMLVIGAVSPLLDLNTVLRLATTFPVEFYILTGKITALTGLGHTVPGKRAPSTETAEFEQP